MARTDSGYLLKVGMTYLLTPAAKRSTLKVIKAVVIQALQHVVTVANGLLYDLQADERRAARVEADKERQELRRAAQEKAVETARNRLAGRRLAQKDPQKAKQLIKDAVDVYAKRIRVDGREMALGDVRYRDFDRLRKEGFAQGALFDQLLRFGPPPNGDANARTRDWIGQEYIEQAIAKAAEVSTAIAPLHDVNGAHYALHMLYSSRAIDRKTFDERMGALYELAGASKPATARGHRAAC